jgi:MFS family permease
MAAALKISRERAERVNKALIGTFFVQAMVTMAIVIRIPEIIDNLHLSNNLAIWGTITGLSGTGSMLALVFAHRLVLRFGTTAVTRYGTLAATVIQGVLPLIGNYWLYFVVTFVQAVFFSLYNNAANGQALMVQKRLKRVVLGTIHGAWSLGVGVASIISGILASFLPLAWHMGIIAGVGFIAHLVLNAQLMNREEEKLSQIKVKVEKKISWLKTPGIIWLLALGLFMGIWPEIVMGDWMSLYSKNVMHLSASLIAIPFTSFAIAMIVGRFATGWISSKMHINRAGMFGGYFGGVGMILGLLASHFLLPINQLLAVSVQAVFFFIAGLGESIMVPAFYSAASHVRSIPPTQALARMGMANSLIFIIAKGVMGTLADTVGLTLAMLFPILAFFGSGYLQGLIGKKADKLEAQNLENYPPTGTIPVVTIKD